MRRLFTAVLVFALIAPCWSGCASSQQSQKQTAADLLTPVSATTPLHMPNEHQKAGVKLALAQTLENSGQIDGAIQTYAMALNAGENPRAAHRLAVLHDQKGQHEKAREYYDIALEQGGDRAAILCDYGYSLYVQRDFTQADTVLREALALREDFPRAHTNLALTLARTGDLPGAIDEFRRAGCDDAAARVNLAYSLAQQNRWEEAMLASQDAVRSDPSSDQAVALFAQLQQRLANSQQRTTNGAVISAQHVTDHGTGRLLPRR